MFDLKWCYISLNEKGFYSFNIQHIVLLNFGDIFIFKHFEILFNRIIVKIYKRKYKRYMEFPLFSFQAFVYTEVFISIDIYLYLDATTFQCEYKYRKI